MNFVEMNNEILECARYGEDDDLRALLVAGADVNFADDSGNTSLHRAAANGEVGCIRVLKEFGALHVANKQGNLPIHWAAQNAKSESLRVLFDCFDVDVLVKNVAGRSTLTDAFESKEVAVIELCLSHSSASEERLLETNDKNAKIVEEDNENESGKESTAKVYNVEEHAVSHQMRFRSDVVVKIRELPITRADHPFGSESAPEDDTTGLGIWPASIILSRWAVQCGSALMGGKVVVELGAGCGLPGIAAALHCRPKSVYITDIHEPTLANAIFNARLNATPAPHAKKEASDSSAAVDSEVFEYLHPSTDLEPASSTAVRVLNANWQDETTFPAEKADVLLGSDLVYDSSILAILVPAVDKMMTQDGCLLYVAPNTGRDGMSELIEALSGVGIECVESLPVPKEMYANPLMGVDEDYFVLHFYDLCAMQPHTLYRFARKQQ